MIDAGISERKEVKLVEREVSQTVIPAQIVEIWQRIVDSISALLFVPSVMINRLEQKELEVFLSNNSCDNPFPAGTRMPLLGVYCEATAKARQRLQVEDARKDPLWSDSPTAKAGIYSYLGFPVFWPDGEVFGTICAVDTKANKWATPSDTLLQTIKDAVEAHLALLDTMGKLDKKNRELELALGELNTLRGLLPICTYCKKVQDIALRKKAEEEKSMLEAQLRHVQKMDAIGLLAGGIAHDFNNLLMPIIGYVELGMMKLSPETELYTDLKRVREATARATDLTRQILAFSRKQVFEMQVIDLNFVVADFKKMVKRLIGEDIELQVFPEPDLYEIKADKGQLEQVLMNLAVNARDAMPAGGKLTIKTANVYLDEAYMKQSADARPPGPYVMLAVSDTGCGMDADTRQKIFEPFFTTKERGKGTGLGLSTVFGIIKQHGGHIWVDSEPDRGTTFKIYLPQAEGAVKAAELTFSEPVALCGKETVLVVEDDELVRQLVCKTLTSCGYNVLEAKDPKDALRLASENRETLRLLLTDVIMPGMNGKELYRKTADIHPDIEVLYMSGYNDDVIAHHGILDEGVNFLQKPFTVQNLTQKVRQVFEYSH
jgi:signal transduction histidine kinase